MNGHTSLRLFYRVNHQMMYWHKYSLNELENMMPWEREIYLQMIQEEIQKQKEKSNARI